MRLLLLPFLFVPLAFSPILGQQQVTNWAAFTTTKRINDLLVHDGNVWSATDGGILRYEQLSQTYTRFTRLNGLAGNRVLSVATDPFGNVWFGTARDGLSRFRPADEEFDLPFVEFAELEVTALVAYDDRIFVGMDRGISAFLIEKEEVKETYRSLGNLDKDTPVTALAVLDGTLWAGTKTGIAWASLSLPNLQDPDSWKSDSTIQPVRDLLVLRDTLYVVSATGVHLVDAASDSFRLDWSRERVAKLGVVDDTPVAVIEEGLFYRRRESLRWDWQQAFPRQREVRSLSRADTALWIGTADGLEVVGTQPAPPPQEPAANQFFEIALVNDDLWIASVPNDRGTTQFGVYKFDGENWNNYDQRNGLPSNIAVATQGDAEDNVWVGTWGRGVSVRDTSGVWHPLDHTNSVLEGIGSSRSFVAIGNIARDQADLIWISNVQIGLVVMDGFPPRRQLLYDQATIGLPSGRDIGKIAFGLEGLKWIATPLDGFILFDDGGTPFVPGDEFALVIDDISEPRLSSRRVRDILVDDENQVWVGTDNGLNAVRGDYSLLSNSYKIVTWRVYNTGNGLPSSDINVLEKDSQGNIWVGTASGLTRIGPDGEVATTLTTANSGLIDNGVNSLRFDEQSGQLWIGTMDGLGRLEVLPAAGEGSARTFPNPFIPRSGSGQMSFADLPLGATVRIYSLDGTLVRGMTADSTSGSVIWNGLNTAGFLVASGIYFYVAEDAAGNRVKGKFAVVNAE